MAGLSGSSSGTLRCTVSPRDVFVWLLLSLLLAGAASYSYGSRYAIIPGHEPFQAVAEHRPQPVPLQAQPEAISSDMSASAFHIARVVHEVGPFVGAEVLLKDRCERRQSPRSEPAPLRTGAVDPPSLTHRQQPGDGIPSTVLPPAPDLPGLTVVDLSISRT